MTTHHTDSPAQRLAAAAPLADDDSDAIEPGAADADKALHALFEDWVAWSRTRRFFSPPPVNTSLLGRLTSKSRPVRPGGPDATCSAELSALHLAIAAQPPDALDRKVFDLHYVWRVRNIKLAAAELGIGRQHWYTLLREFRRRCHGASLEILSVNLAAGDALPHRKD